MKKNCVCGGWGVKVNLINESCMLFVLLRKGEGCWELRIMNITYLQRGRGSRKILMRKNIVVMKLTNNDYHEH